MRVTGLEAKVKIVSISIITVIYCVLFAAKSNVSSIAGTQMNQKDGHKPLWVQDEGASFTVTPKT